MENPKEQMTTYRKCVIIRNSLLTRVGEALSYAEWTDDYRIKNIFGITESVEYWEEESSDSFKINPNDLTLEQCQDLGFGKWDEQTGIWLIPLWLFSFLCEEFDCLDIFGNKHSKLSELDSDHRFGCLAYGIVPKDVQVSSQTDL